MNNYKGNTPNNSINEKLNKLLSGQVRITLQDVKKLVESTNQGQGLYNETREQPNRIIQLYIEQNNAVYSLAYEIKITPATIYKIFAIKGKHNEHNYFLFA